MYNGIGLTTPRGSGTNGYVQRNLSTVHKFKDKNFKVPDDIPVPSLRRGNTDIIEHDRKRKVEVKCMEFQSLLEDQGYSQEEIEKRVSSYRQSLSEENSEGQKDKHGRLVVKETHEIAEAQVRKNEKLRQAFGISEYFVDGSSFDPERRAKEIAAKAALEEETKKYALIPSPSSSGDELTVVEEEDQAPSSSKKRKVELSPSSGTDTKKSKSNKKKNKKKKRKKKHKRKHASSSENEDERSSLHKAKSNKMKKKDRDSSSVSTSKVHLTTRRSEDDVELKGKHKKKTSNTSRDKSSRKSRISHSSSLLRSDEDSSKKRKRTEHRRDRKTGTSEKEKRNRASPSPIPKRAKNIRHSITDSSHDREKDSDWKIERGYRKRSRSKDKYERKKSNERRHRPRKRKSSSSSSPSSSEENRTNYQDAWKSVKRNGKETGGHRKYSPSISPKRKKDSLRESSIEPRRNRRRDLSPEVEVDGRNRTHWSTRDERKEKPTKRKYRQNSRSASTSSSEEASSTIKATRHILKSKVIRKSARDERDTLMLTSLGRGKDVARRNTSSSDSSERDRKRSPRFHRRSGKDKTELEWKTKTSRSSDMSVKPRMTVENESDDEITTPKAAEKARFGSRRVDEEKQSIKSKIKGRVDSPAAARVFVSPSRSSKERKELASQRRSNVNNLDTGIVETTSKVANRDGSTSSSLSYSPMEKYPHRYQDILNDMPIKSRKEELISTQKCENNKNVISENGNISMEESSVSKSASSERFKKNEILSTKVSADHPTFSPLPSATTVQATVTTENAATETKMNPPFVCLDDVPLPPERDTSAISSKKESTNDRISTNKKEVPSSKVVSTDVAKLGGAKTDTAKIKLSPSPRRTLSISSRKRRSSSSSSHSSPKKRSKYSSLSSSPSKSSRSSDRSNSDSPSSSSEYSSHACSSRRTRRSPSDSLDAYKSRRSSSYSSSVSSRSRSRSSSVNKRKKRRRKSRSNSESRSDSSSSYSRSRSRSISIPRRRGSPSFLERRRITSRRRSISSSSSSSSSTSTSSSTSSGSSSSTS